MAIVHAVRCDGEQCKAEKALTVAYSSVNVLSSSGPQTMQQAPGSYSVPSDWLTVDSRNFCSFRCLADYAGAKAKGQGY